MHFSGRLCRHVLLCMFVCFRGKILSVPSYFWSSSSSASMLNMQQAWNGSVGFTRSNCSGSGGQGNLEELKLSRRSGTWPLRLAVRDSFWLPVKKSSFSAAQLQKLYHALDGEFHAECCTGNMKTDSLWLSLPLWLVQTHNVPCF